MNTQETTEIVVDPQFARMIDMDQPYITVTDEDSETSYTVLEAREDGTLIVTPWETEQTT